VLRISLFSPAYEVKEAQIPLGGMSLLYLAGASHNARRRGQKDIFFVEPPLAVGKRAQFWSLILDTQEL
jgi:hypothetical protein